MRVIWISIGIFITVFAIAFGLHDPDADSPFFASEQTKPQIENPFVEGEPENNQADLTASSENKQQENLKSNVNQTLNSQEDVAVFAPSNGAVDSIQKSADGIDNQTLESNIDQEPAVVARGLHGVERPGIRRDAVKVVLRIPARRMVAVERAPVRRDPVFRIVRLARPEKRDAGGIDEIARRVDPPGPRNG